MQLGQAGVFALLDLHAYYDSMVLADLFLLAVGQRYPTRILLLACIQYLSVRHVTQEGWMSGALYPGVSVCAGETNANAMSKILLYDLLEDFTYKWTLHAALGQWVDDRAVDFQGTALQLKRIVPQALLELRGALTRRQLTLSVKSVALASTKELLETSWRP